MPKMPNPAGSAKKRAPEPVKPTAPITWMRVLEDRQVPRPGGSYMLRAGKEISSASYDFGALRRAGVKLEPMTEPPQAWQDAQLAAVRKREEIIALRESQDIPTDDIPEGIDPTAPEASPAA